MKEGRKRLERKQTTCKPFSQPRQGLLLSLQTLKSCSTCHCASACFSNIEYYHFENGGVVEWSITSLGPLYA